MTQTRADEIHRYIHTQTHSNTRACARLLAASYAMPSKVRVHSLFLGDEQRPGRSEDVGAIQLDLLSAVLASSCFGTFQSILTKRPCVGQKIENRRDNIELFAVGVRTTDIARISQASSSLTIYRILNFQLVADARRLGCRSSASRNRRPAHSWSTQRTRIPL